MKVRTYLGGSLVAVDDSLATAIRELRRTWNGATGPQCFELRGEDGRPIAVMLRDGADSQVCHTLYADGRTEHHRCCYVGPGEEPGEPFDQGAAQREARRQRVQALRTAGKSLRTIAEREGVSRAAVARDLVATGAAPDGAVSAACLPADLVKAERLIAEGSSLRSAARKVGLSESTLRYRLKRQEAGAVPNPVPTVKGRDGKRYPFRKPKAARWRGRPCPPPAAWTRWGWHADTLGGMDAPFLHPGRADRVRAPDRIRVRPLVLLKVSGVFLREG